MSRLLTAKLFAAILLCLSIANTAEAFDLAGKQRSYLSVQRFQLFAGTGFGGLISDNGVTSDGLDLAYRIGLGYSLTRRARLEFFYQLGFLPISSPDPLSNGNFRSKLLMHSEVWRLFYRFDYWSVYPFLHVGLGFYQMGSVNPQTGLGFSTSLQMPVGAGLETYLYKNQISVTLEYMYHVLFDEDQGAGVLALLGVNDVSFDVQGINLQLYFHLF